MQNLKKIDLFGQVFNLNINRNDKEYKSVIGGITSFLLYSCSLSYFIYKIYLWSSGQIQPNITNQPTSYVYQQHTFTKSPLMISMLKLDEDPFDLENNYITIFYQQYVGLNISQPQILIPQYINTSNPFQSLFIIPQNVTLVLNPTGLQEQGQQQQTKGGLLLALCDKQLISQNITCASDEKLQKFIQIFQGIELWITVEIYDTDTKQISSIVQEIHQLIDVYSPFFTQFQFKMTMNDIDDNIFITTSETSSYISSYTTTTQPFSQQIIYNKFGFKAFGMFMLSLSSDGNNQMVSYPKLGQILADVGSIMSTLLSISIIVQMINSVMLEDKILFQIISSYFPEIKKYKITKDYFGNITNVEFNNEKLDKQQYQIQYDMLKEKARNKISFINQVYEISRLQFIIQGLVDKQTIINSHKLGIKWLQNPEETIQYTNQEFQIEDFTLLSLDLIEKQDDIKIYEQSL
ncbi:hypothetical protein pb186bvf_019274 [Paramecium bursaria]